MVFSVSGSQLSGVVGFLIGVAAVAIYVAARFSKPMRRRLDWLDEFRDDWRGVPDRDGVPGRPGVMVRLAGMEARQAGTEAELRTNGGSSLRDAVKRIETGMTAMQAQLDAAHVIALPAPAQPAGGAVSTTPPRTAA